MNLSYIESGRKKQKQKTRNIILASAKKFLTLGKDFTLEDVAKETKLSRATVYRYFSNVEVLSREAGLDLNTKSPASIVKPIKHLSTAEILINVQDYFNGLAIDNEAAFRKYLSVVVASTTNADKRGARRTKTLRLALEKNDLDLPELEIEKLIVVATVLMGIEAITVTKDVCRLDNKGSTEVLNWGLEMIIEGIRKNRSD